MLHLVHALFAINLLYQFNWPAKTDFREAGLMPPPPINSTSIDLSHIMLTLSKKKIYSAERWMSLKEDPVFSILICCFLSSFPDGIFIGINTINTFVHDVIVVIS